LIYDFRDINVEEIIHVVSIYPRWRFDLFENYASKLYPQNQIKTIFFQKQNITVSLCDRHKSDKARRWQYLIAEKAEIKEHCNLWTLV
jgi:hypothetical protein